MDPLWVALIAVLPAAVTAGTTFLYAALGEILSERAGVLNLGVEGMMLTGGVIGFTVTLKSGNVWVGLFGAAAGGAALALIHAGLCIHLRANQIVSGLALTIFGTGLASYLGKPLVGIPLPQPFRPIEIPVLAQIPVIGPALFHQNAMVYLSYLIVPALWYLIERTRPGLHLRSVGENPAAADAMGINVYTLRYVYVLAGGAFCGMAGAHLSLAVVPSWVEGLTAGRGWVAVARVIFALGPPWPAVFGAYLFGGVEALTFSIQLLTHKVSPILLSALPYLFTIAVLLLASSQTMKRRLGAPAALGLPYERESR